ncbi:helix-turn-helix domain-containing protein [Paenibacillus koleovorans]|uniref:helix-turn-helix domain-containing protein n=1 Tax=Paenibacillus koleovorans TaxID=121608 RepID=UPI000FDC51F9|nr:helix-turn-helix domain-containing protein [Paenibacillus koleovorans]
MFKRFKLEKPWSFKRKLTAFSILISIIPVFILGFVSAHMAARSIQEEVDRNHQLALKQIEFQINNIISNLNIFSIILATNVSVERSVQLGPSNVVEFIDMADTVNKQRYTSSIRYHVSLIYKKYDYVYSTLYSSTKYSDSKYFKMLESTPTNRNSPLMITPHTYPGQDELLLFRPVPLNSNYTESMLVLHLDTTILEDFIQSLEFSFPSHLYVLDETGKVIMTRDKEETGKQLATTVELFRYWKNPSGYHGNYSLEGKSYKISALQSESTGWTYVAMSPLEMLTEKSDHIRMVTWMFMLVITTFWILLSLVGSRRLYGPIEKLVHKFNPNNVLHKHESDDLAALDSIMQQMERNNYELRGQLKGTFSTLKDTMTHSLLLGGMTEQEVLIKAAELNYSLHGSWFAVCSVAVDEDARFLQTYRERDRTLIHYAMRKIMEEVCERRISCITFVQQPGQMAVILGTETEDENDQKLIMEIVHEFRSCMEKYLQFTVSIAVSPLRMYYTSIHACHLEAQELLSYRMLLGTNVVITKDTAEEPIKQSGRLVAECHKQIISNILQGDLNHAVHHLEQMTSYLPSHVRNSGTAMGVYGYLIGEIEAIFYEIGSELQELFENDLYKHLYSLRTIEEVKMWFAGHVFPEIIKYLEDQKKSREKITPQHILIYIHEHYDKDLSLQHVADQFQMNASQFGRYFREETGTNFSDYLIEFRIGKAKEWLSRTDMPIKEIAERLRYTTVQNFTRIFKQVVGCPPGEYRMQQKKEHDR